MQVVVSAKGGYFFVPPLCYYRSVVVEPCAVPVLGLNTVPYYKGDVSREMLSCKTEIISLVNYPVFNENILALVRVLWRTLNIDTSINS